MKYRDTTKVSIYHDNTLTAGQRLKLTTIQLHMTSVVEIDMDSSQNVNIYIVDLITACLDKKLLGCFDGVICIQ
jgi:hypothetical protein